MKELEKAFGRDVSLPHDPEKISCAWPVEVSFCCDMMEANWDEEFITFDFRPDEVLVGIRHREFWHDGEEQVVPIRYCPWCGGKIQLIRVPCNEGEKDAR